MNPRPWLTRLLAKAGLVDLVAANARVQCHGGEGWGITELFAPGQLLRNPRDEGSSRLKWTRYNAAAAE